MLGWLLVALALAATPSAVRAEADPLVTLRTWQPTTFPPNASDEQARASYINGTQILAEPAHRRLYAVNDLYQWVAAYDLDSLAPLGQGLHFSGHPQAAVADAHTGSLFVSFIESPTGGRVWIDQFTIDESGVKRIATLDLSGTLPLKAVVGFARVPGTDIVHLLAQSVANAFDSGTSGGTTVVELDMPSGLAAARVGWQIEATGCLPAGRIWFASAAIGFVPEQRALYFGCINETNPVVRARSRGIGRLALRSDPQQGATPAPATGDFVLFSRDGDFSRKATSLFDSGSSRLVITGSSSSGGAAAYVFDAVTNSWVGGIAGGGNAFGQSGIDPVIGRFYTRSWDAATGFVVADLRATPVSQGRNFPTDNGAAADGSDGSLAVDPITRRVFTRHHPPSGRAFYSVVQDRIPPYRPALDDDPDAATRDVDEMPGRTTSTFSALATGFGSRLRQIGGYGNVVVNTTNVDHRGYPVGPGTRELRGAYLRSLRLGNGEAMASAVSFDRDLANTQADLDKAGEPGAWPFEPASCIDLSNEGTTDERDDSTVRCDAGAAVASAASKSRQIDAQVVRMESGTVSATAHRSPDRGSVATITSTARGIDIAGGRVRIGKVEVTAEVSAHGRPGTAKASYTRRLTGVVLDGVQHCGDNCEAEDVARRVNAQFGGRIRIAFPEPDPTFLATKGGYRGGIRIRTETHLENMLFNEQPADRYDLPGLVATVFEDNTRPGRTIFEAAGVQLEVTYAISLVGDDVAVGGEGDRPAAVDPLGRPLGVESTSSGAALAASTDAVDAPLSFDAGTARRQAPGRPETVLSAVRRIVLNGLSRTLGLLPVWGVLVTPVFLSARRRALLLRSPHAIGGA
ncbi:MAG: hypothetical protein M3394_02180 [Actinomycetota bacterium]|nr:hypothetical protein [Actinomycetota bacterium]